MGLGDAVMIATLALNHPGAQGPLRAEAAVTSTVVRLSDVARLGGVPAALRSRAAAIPVARFGAGQTRIVVAGGAVAERARGAMPALTVWAATLDGARIPVTRRIGRATSAAPARTCLRALRPMEAGAAAVREDFDETACTARAEALGYDRIAGLARAGRAIEAGDLVRGLPARTMSAVRPGQSLTLRAAVGPVVVERSVEVLRPARPGAPVFVRGDDGDVFAAPASTAEVDQ
jgi:hypothetical protein